MLRKGLQTILQTVLIVCLVNGVFVFIYLSNTGESGSDDSETRSLSLQEILSDANATNDLISRSHLSIRPKQLKIIYYKTHKTASTTVGNILFRLGAQHGAKFNPFDKHYYTFFKEPPYGVDISLHHHYPIGYEDMMAHYKKMIPKGKFLTVLRDPLKRYLSHYHYYREPYGETYAEFMKKKEYNNYLAKDLGIWHTNELESFIDKAYDQFIFLITEKLDESLMMLKNEWGWTFQDILYVKLNDACAYGFNWAKLPMSCRPQYENLTSAEIKKMKENNKLDIKLYEKALNDTNAKLAEQPQSFWNELALFRHIRGELQQLCAGKNKTFPETCAMYRINDGAYESWIRASGGQISNFTISTVEFVTL